MKRLTKVSFSLGRMGSTGLLSAVSLVTFYFYNFKFALNPVLNGIALAIGNITIILSSILSGYLSDRLNIRVLGRRKYFIFTGSFLLGISFLMIYIPDIILEDYNDIILFMYEATWVGLFYFFYGYIFVPHLALLPEIADEVERVELSAYMNIFNIFGNGVGILLSGLIIVFMNNSISLLEILLAIALIEFSFYIPLVLYIRESDRNIKVSSFLKEMKWVLEHRSFLIWNIVQGILEIGLTIFVTLFLVYLKLTNLLSFSYLPYVAIAGIFVIASYIIWPKLRRRMSSIKAISLTILLMDIGMLVTPIMLLHMIFLVLFLAAVGSSLIGYWIYRYVIIADLVDEIYAEYGVSKSAFYYGVNSVFLNIFLFIGHTLSGFIAALPEQVLIPFFGHFIAIFLSLGLFLLYVTKLKIGGNTLRLKKN